jgi:hypothetical protein
MTDEEIEELLELLAEAYLYLPSGELKRAVREILEEHQS